MFGEEGGRGLSPHHYPPTTHYQHYEQPQDYPGTSQVQYQEYPTKG